MYSITTATKFGCFVQNRLKFQNYNFRIKKTRHLNALQKLFWVQVTLPTSEKIAINLRSMAKRLKVTPQDVKSLAIKFNKLDEMIAELESIAPFSNNLAKEEFLTLKESLILKKEIESQKNSLLMKAEKNGSAISKIGNRHLLAHLNPENGSVNFFLSLQKPLGKGAFRTVFPLMDYQTSKVSMALSVQKSEKASHTELMQREYSFLKTLEKVKQVVKPYFLIQEGEFLYLATKRGSETFDDFLDYEFSQKKKLEFFKEVLKGVAAIHKHGIIHRDIKPQNILLTKKQKVKIIDFNLSCLKTETEKLTRFAGTPAYQPPEVILRKIKELPEKIDAWSLGIILYQICEEKKPKFCPLFKEQNGLPQEERDEQKLMHAVKNLKFSRLKKGDRLIPIIQGLLNPDPHQRLSAKEALKKL